MEITVIQFAFSNFWFDNFINSLWVKNIKVFKFPKVEILHVNSNYSRRKDSQSLNFTEIFCKKHAFSARLEKMTALVNVLKSVELGISYL